MVRAMQILAASLKAKVRQRTLELQVLNELTAKVQLADSADEIWSACLEYLDRLIPGSTILFVGFANVLWTLPPDDRIYLQHSHPLTDRTTAKIKARLQAARVEWIAGNRDWAYNIALPPIAQFKSILMAPANSDESAELLGVFFIGAEQISGFNFEHLCLLHTAAHICANSLLKLSAKTIDVKRENENTLALACPSQESLLRALMDGSPDRVFVKDRNFRYILVNPSFAEYLGISIEEIIGKDDLELGFSETAVFGDRSGSIKGIREEDRAVLAGEIVRNTYQAIAFEGRKQHVFDTQKLPLCDAQGDIFAVLGIKDVLFSAFKGDRLVSIAHHLPGEYSSIFLADTLN